MRPLSLFYVGHAPGYLGGAAIRDELLLSGLVERGHRVAALALEWQYRSVRWHVRTTWSVTMPRFAMRPARPQDEARLWQRQSRAVQRHLPALLDLHRPDAVLFGKERFALGIPSMDDRRRLPCVVFAQSAKIRYDVGARSDRIGERVAAALDRADLLICCARHVAADREALGIVPVRTIPNGVATGPLHPERPCPNLSHDLGIAPDAVVALHASNLASHKRPLDLVGSAALALRQCPRLMYVVVGQGPDLPAMQAACVDHGVADHFRFIGRIDHDHMPGHLALADMVLVPSISEAMSLACLEAMACGKLVIASDIPGSREIIRDGATGLLFRTGDVEDLAIKTVTAAREPQLRARIGRAARAHVEQHHRLDDMITRYETVLADLIRHHRSGHPFRDPVGHRPGP